MKSRCSDPRCKVHYLHLFAVIRAYFDHVDTNQYRCYDLGVFWDTLDR